ncbi:galactokinase [Granulicella sp. 5B5]|uniref:galactokinase n=1 Tax=Granulicella sp. 5B5 TaxID=1617967 RepID=UPI0015F729DB|nr:galactokinase [Granulicella sp. 5B5]QMV19475.1 galactokinase [Granulicella sp. 5B5]
MANIHPSVSAPPNTVRANAYIAPARVNLLGEHTDYTGGLVLPMAIPFYTQARITPATTGGYRFSSEIYPAATREISLSDQSPRIDDWSDYPVGVLHQLQMRGIRPSAFDLHLSGNVPFAAGLSSSASVEVATAYALLATANASLPLEEVSVLCRAAENEYVGSPCGIMDQFAIAAAKAGHALLLNTRTLEYDHLPMNQGDLSGTYIVVCNSMVKHSVASGEYGVRHREVMEGQEALLKKFPTLRDLGDATLGQLEAARADMPPESFLRCRHIISDNHRVLQAREAMFAGDPRALGELMLQGHSSERDDFACSCEEIDFLVDTAAALPGCYGSRLTGGGFGGCTVNLVDRAQSAPFSKALSDAYKKAFSIDAEIYICEPVDGAALRNTGGLHA